MSQSADAISEGGEFARRTEPFRRELLAHCYRMLGSIDEAEDLVQETYLRAWRAYGGFEGRSSLRVWLYRIATNACLSALQHSSRRALPSGLGGPVEDQEAVPAVAAPDVRWLQPIADALVTPESEDPAVIVAGREGLRLALIASLQHLPARQRAVLILREVLAFPAAEVAAMLDTSTAAVKSLLQRARSRLEQVASAAEQVDEPAEPELRELLDQYITAFENADVSAMEQVLRKDAALEVVPSGTWVAGREHCLRIIREVLGSPGDWRMLPTSANGQPAAAAYLRGDDGTHRAFGIAVLTTTSTGIARIVVFGEPDLVTSFGFPPVHPPSAGG
jgi:RNA polymerase sigma-70 factor (ECF subfamily)